MKMFCFFFYVSVFFRDACYIHVYIHFDYFHLDVYMHII